MGAGRGRAGVPPAAQAPALGAAGFWGLRIACCSSSQLGRSLARVPGGELVAAGSAAAAAELVAAEAATPHSSP